MPTFARQVDAIPVVQTTAQRAVLFPSPEPNQRVQNLETGAIERWTNGAWATDGVQATTAKLYAGTGTPEGNVTAAMGSLFLRTDGGASTTLYVKTSGSGSTGWTAK